MTLVELTADVFHHSLLKKCLTMLPEGLFLLWGVVLQQQYYIILQ